MTSDESQCGLVNNLDLNTLKHPHSNTHMYMLTYVLNVRDVSYVKLSGDCEDTASGMYFIHFGSNRKRRKSQCGQKNTQQHSRTV